MESAEMTLISVVTYLCGKVTMATENSIYKFCEKILLCLILNETCFPGQSICSTHMLQDVQHNETYTSYICLWYLT